jgi:hypothetical protein
MRRTFNAEVGSSSLSGPTLNVEANSDYDISYLIKNYAYYLLWKHSSMAERLLVKQKVECSNHSVSAIVSTTKLESRNGL